MAPHVAPLCSPVVGKKRTAIRLVGSHKLVAHVSLPAKTRNNNNNNFLHAALSSFHLAPGKGMVVRYLPPQQKLHEDAPTTILLDEGTIGTALFTTVGWFRPGVVHCKASLH